MVLCLCHCVDVSCPLTCVVQCVVLSGCLWNLTLCRLVFLEIVALVLIASKCHVIKGILSK